MRRLATLVFAGLSSSLLAGCHAPVAAMLGPAVKGNGVIRAESRPVVAFGALRVEGALQVVYTPGELAPVTITGDENILPLVVAEVTDGRLLLGFRANTSLRPTQAVRVAVTAPALDRIAVSGASEVSIPQRLATPSLTLDLDGAGRLEATDLAVTALAVDLGGASRATLGGRGEAVVLKAGGAARLDAAKLAATTARIDLSGAAHADLSGTGQLTGELSGAAQVQASGREAAVGVRTSGAAGVRVR
jgi:hypothetical protein